MMKWHRKPSYIHRQYVASMSITPIETRPFKQDAYKTSPSCEVCYSIANYEALYEIESMIVVKRYCQDCIQNAEF